MARTKTGDARVQELRALLAAYRHLTVEEAERGNWGDMQMEVEGELWRLEQERFEREARRRSAA